MWAPAGVVFVVVAVVAWLYAGDVRAMVATVQKAYGCGPQPSAWLRADVHLHAVVAFLATLWVGLGCRLFAPRGLPWLAVGTVLVVAWTDEIIQIGSANRAFEFQDLLAEGIGAVAAIPLLLLLRRLEVGRPGGG